MNTAEVRVAIQRKVPPGFFVAVSIPLVIVAVVLVATGVLSNNTVTSPGSAGNPAPTLDATTHVPTFGPSSSGPGGDLLARMPQALRVGCSRTSTRLVCPGRGKDAPASVRYDSFITSLSATDAFNEDRSLIPAASCRPGHRLASWRAVDGRSSGTIACSTSGTRSELLWTWDSDRIVAGTTATAIPLARLVAWWMRTYRAVIT